MRLTRFDAVRPSLAERADPLPGDDLVGRPDVVMDRAFTLAAPPEGVWPWMVQLGKGRAGWYLPRSVERFVPPARRALRRIEPALQGLAVGDVIADWGGNDATFTTAELRAPSALVYTSRRGRTELSWAIVLHTIAGSSTRVQLRLRLAPVRHVRLAETGGGFFDLLTIAGLATGLRERLD